MGFVGILFRTQEILPLKIYGKKIKELLKLIYLLKKSKLFK